MALPGSLVGSNRFHDVRREGYSFGFRLDAPLGLNLLRFHHSCCYRYDSLQLSVFACGTRLGRSGTGG